MRLKSASASLVLRAAIAAVALAGVASTAAPVLAQAYVTNPAIDRLAHAIESAALAAVTDARSQGLNTAQSQAAAAAAVEAVIAQSGEDTGVILAALTQAKSELALRNDATLSIALNLVGRDMSGAFVAPAAPGHGTPPGGAPPPGGGGGAEYRPPVH